MSEDEDVLRNIISNCSLVAKLLKGTKDLEHSLSKLDLSSKRNTSKLNRIWDKTKRLIEQVHKDVTDIKEEFYKHYENLKIGDDTEDEKNKDSSGNEEDPLQDSVTDSSDIINSSLVSDTEKSREIVKNGIVEADKQASDAEDPESESFLSERVTSESESVTNESEKAAMETESVLVESESVGETTENDKLEEIKDVKPPIIKLVNISKLLDPANKNIFSSPKQKKSVKFDSSVIILTSSDEDSPKKQDLKKSKEQSPIKSALKKSAKEFDPIKVTSDSDSKENDENDCRKSKRVMIVKEKIKSKFSKLAEERSKRRACREVSGRTPNNDAISHSDKEKSFNRKDSKKLRSPPPKNDSSDDENSEGDLEQRKPKGNYVDKRNSKKSKEEKCEEKKREKEKENNTSDENEKSDNTSDKAKEANSRTRKKSKKKEILEESSLSDTSSSSEIETDKLQPKKEKVQKIKKKKQNKSPEKEILLDENDVKFKSEVFISLPKYDCDKLKDLYLEKKEVFDIKRLRKMDFISKRTRSSKTQNEPSSKSSSDSEKPKQKRPRITLTIKKPRPQKDQSSSAEELASDPDDVHNTDDVHNPDENMTDPLDIGDKAEDDTEDKIAEMLVEGMQDHLDEENKSDNDDSDTSGEDKKKRKKSYCDKDDKNEKSQKRKKSLGEDSDEHDDGDKKKKGKEDKAESDSNEDKSETNEKEKNSDSESTVEESEKSKILSEKEKKSGKGSNEEKCDKSKKKEKEKEKEDGKELTNGKADASDQEDKEKEKDKENTSDTDSDSDEKKKDKKKWRNNRLLTSKIDSSDSDKEFSKYCKKKEKGREELVRKAKRIIKKGALISDSDSEDNKKDKSSGEEFASDDEKKSSSSASDKEDDKETEEKEPKKKSRRRIKRTNDSSSDDEDKSTRKQIRRVIDRDSLSEKTKQAEADEKERKARIAEKQKKYNQIVDLKTDAKIHKVVLDYDDETKEELLTVHKGLVKKLKPHQASGIQFMWDACFESLKRMKKNSGSGCILAHCMGLGKTLQVIALTHTLLTNEVTGVKKVMVVCPVNTVLNWKSEYKKWMPDEDDFEIYELVSCKQNYERQYAVTDWHQNGGVLIIGYSMFRNISNPDNKRISKKMRMKFVEGLVDPGPDLVVCDEGHLLKNEKTHLSIAMNRVKTLRRIVLTGTPLQNNLREYWCMVQFIKPNLLGTYKEYLNRFVNPITNGQYTDSTQHDIQIMRKRSHVLHKLLDGVVQRRDYAVLAPYLPPKYEYVLFVTLTETQVKLYKHYMDKFSRKNDGSNRTSFLFTDFQALQRICTHPRVLLDKSKEINAKKWNEESDSEGSLKDFIDDGVGETTSESEASSSGSEDGDSSGSDKKSKKKKPAKTRVTRAQAAQKRENGEDSDVVEIEETVPKQWWHEYCEDDQLNNINLSNKLFLLFEILKECEQIGDKLLLFSQSLYTLNCLEYFLEKIDEATQNGDTESVGGHSGSWALGLDYFRLDGSSSCDNRASWCDSFNNPNNTRARLFLISTKAGGLGINLVAANRVIIFDVSWNPSHDIQSIYRVYRFGQTKPCYVYRFVTYGTMEMKIYERQVTKQAISKRVIDEQQIDRHYSQNDIQELYNVDLTPTDRPIPLVPKDVLLGEMLQKYEKEIYKYHEHQSLLENKEDEVLNEEERKSAWEEFENEKILRKNTTSIWGNAGMAGFNNVANLSPQAISAALINIVRKDNPSWSEVQIKGIIPALVQQLQVQMTEGDLTMYNRVQNEIRLIQAIHAQRLKEQYYQQQMMRMMQQQQQQQQQAKMMGNLHVTPEELAQSQQNMLNAILRAGPSRNSASRPSATADIIELND